MLNQSKRKLELHPKVTTRDKAWDYRGKHQFLISCREQTPYAEKHSENVLGSINTENSRTRKRCAHTQEN